MSDGDDTHPVATSLSEILEAAMRVAHAPLGLVLEHQPSGQIMAWAHRTIVQRPAATGRPPVTTSISYAPHLLPPGTLEQHLARMPSGARPRMLSIGDQQVSALANFYQVEGSPSLVDQALIVPSQNEGFAMVLLAPHPWSSPSLDELGAQFSKAVSAFVASRRGNENEALTRLVLAISSALSRGTDAETAMGEICALLAESLAYGVSAVYSLDGERLLPLHILGSTPDGPQAVQPTPEHVVQLWPDAVTALESGRPLLADASSPAGPPESVRAALGIDGEFLVLPVQHMRSPLGMILLANPRGPGSAMVRDEQSATLLISHLSLVVAQILDDRERSLRHNAWVGMQPMLEASAQISATEELGDFLARSLAVSLGLSHAFFLVFDPQRRVSDVRFFGPDRTRRQRLLDRLEGQVLTSLPGSDLLFLGDGPLFIEPGDTVLYTPLVRSLVDRRAFLMVPITTSAGFMGIAAATHSAGRPFFDSRERAIAADWSIAATLAADNIGLRMAEMERLESYREKAFKDSLTGLPNRELFYDRLLMATAKAERSDQVTAVIFIDIDFFKQVNDRFGHLVGDELLVQVAKRLTSCFRDTDTVARLSGDEFVVLLENAPSHDAIIEIAKRAFDRLNDAYLVGPNRIEMGASMGIAIGRPGANGTELLRHADSAMYRSKESGRARLSLYLGQDHDDSTVIDLRSFDSQGQPRRRTTAVDISFADPGLRFRGATGESAPQASANETPWQENGPDSGSLSELIARIGEPRLEMVRPQLAAGAPEAADPLALISLLAQAGPLLLERVGRPAKLQVSIESLRVDDLDNLAEELAAFRSSVQAGFSLVLSVSALRLGQSANYIEHLASVAAANGAELMVTSVHEREVRLYDLLAPAIAYWTLPYAEALRELQASTPNQLSSIATLALSRNVCLCTNGVTDASMIAPLVLAGVCLLSGQALGPVAERYFGIGSGGPLSVGDELSN